MRSSVPFGWTFTRVKSKISAGLSCGALHTVCKGIIQEDIVLSPDGRGSYMVGEIVGPFR